MGWWRIGDLDHGGIAFITGITEECEQEYFVTGDGPADIMGDAVERIVALYEEQWDRKPNMRELRATLNFASGHLELEE